VHALSMSHVSGFFLCPIYAQLVTYDENGVVGLS
jgi:hypothetical protein